MKARRSLPARWLGGDAHQQALWLLPVPLTKRRRLYGLREKTRLCAAVPRSVACDTPWYNRTCGDLTRPEA